MTDDICSTCSNITPKLINGSCKKCYKKQWYERNRNKEAIKMATYYKNNADKLKTYAKEYFKENKHTLLDKTREYKKDYYSKNKDKIKANIEANREDIRIKKQNYYQNNKNKINNSHKLYLSNNISAKIAARIRTRIWIAIKNKNCSLPEYLGCSLNELMLHLQSKFVEGMTWDNYGEWHIDHIKPLVLFDLTDVEQLKQASNFTNLQPLWWRDNIVKGARYE
jgi:hypothetical protein